MSNHQFKVLFITPHLSTGGGPQYLLKKIQELKNDCDIYCIEYSDITGGVLVVQRNQIKEILGNKLITLGENKAELMNHINSINPDIVHFEEMPEYFCNHDIAKNIYNKNRRYKIIETSHDSSFEIQNKCFYPDRFVFVSEYQKQMFAPLNIPSDVVLYPIEYKIKTDRTEALKNLGLDVNKVHFLNVGLFTSRKNQKEIIQYAKELLNEPVQFHFVGNQADNFREYWEPLMKDFPSNCKWWGERKDVDTFYNAMDIFLFTSKGTAHDKETNPLVLREAIGWRMPILMYNLPVYCGMYDEYKNITYLSDNFDHNLSMIKGFYTKELPIDIVFTAPNKFELTNYGPKTKYLVSIKDCFTNIPMYHCEVDFTEAKSWYIVPNGNKDFSSETFFSTFLIEFYDLNKNLLGKKKIKVKDLNYMPVVLNVNFSPFDCLYINYKQMFYENIYGHLQIDNLNTVLDIGANVGLFSLYMANRGSKKIYAFEPTRKAFDQLSKVLGNNDKFTLIKKAIFNTNGKLKIKSVQDNSTISGFMKEAHEYTGNNVTEEEVDVITLNSFYTSENIKNIDLIKIDIEGAEYEVIAGLRDQEIVKCPRYIIEYHLGNKKNVFDIVNRFTKLNYKIINIEDPKFLNETGFFYAHLNNEIS
jgi:FkbM family methyltransferase